MRSRWMLSVIAAVSVAVAIVPMARAAPPGEVDGASPELGELVSGELTYLDGTHVWTDYAYDDRGANTSAGGAGIAVYPASTPNAADLIQLQVSSERGTRITAVLETLVDPSLPLLGVGFDVDANPATGAPTVPGGAWRNQSSLGLERFVVIDSRRAVLLSWSGSSWDEAATLVSSVDASRNTMSATIPAPALPRLGEHAQRLVGVLGITTSSWLDGGGPIFDLAYVRDERPVAWQHTKQADILAGHAPPDGALATVDPAQVRRRATTTPVLGPGYHTFLYRSTLELPEGIGRGAAGSTLYLGPYQPYQVWLPDELPAPAPLLVMLHGAGGTHLQPLFAGAPDAGSAPDGLANTTFDVSAVVVSPLGRGERSFYWGVAEQDVLDVIADAERRFAIDPDRVVLSGISMGGIGTWRLGQLYPDRFSALVPIISPSMYQLEELYLANRHFEPTALENLLNAPVRVLAGRVDPLASVAASPLGHETDFVALANLGTDIKYWSMLRRQHELSPAAQNCVLLEALAMRRDANPARIRYTTEPNLELSDPNTGLDLRYRRAYWVTDLASRAQTSSEGQVWRLTNDPTIEASIDVASLSRPDRVTTSEVQPPVTGQNIVTPGDVCGTPGSAVQTLDAWTMSENRVRAGTVDVGNGLELTLTNVWTATLDLARASVVPGAPVTLHVTGDGPATLHLLGAWPDEVDVTRDGRPAGRLRQSDGRLTVGGDFAGMHTFVLTPVAAAHRGP